MSHNPLDAARDEGFVLGQSAQIETLRDRFAIAALPGLIERYAPDINEVVREAYLYADAMMEARK